MAGFNGYNNPYNYNQPNYNPYMQEFQNMRDSIDRTMQRYQQQQQQNPMQQQPVPTNLTQTFQLAPQINSNSELQCQYADNIEQVKNTFVMKNAIFVTKDLSTMWQKDVSGNIRFFKTEEVIPRDEKDLEIQQLKKKLSDMEDLLANTMQSTTQSTEKTETKPKVTKK